MSKFTFHITHFLVILKTKTTILTTCLRENIPILFTAILTITKKHPLNYIRVEKTVEEKHKDSLNRKKGFAPWQNLGTMIFHPRNPKNQSLYPSRTPILRDRYLKRFLFVSFAKLSIWHRFGFRFLTSY